MATGTEELGRVLPVAGVRTAAVSSNIRYENRLDLVLIELSAETRVAGVFTRNAFCAAPVVLARRHLQACQGRARYFLINTGNANAGTGEQGLRDALSSCEAAARELDVAVETILPFSTGVIGEKLPVERLIAGLPAAREQLQSDNWQNAARGIMTTDTRPKACSVQLEFGGSLVTLTGITKGAGMIKPNMATMLAFVCTDAEIEQPLLQELLQSAVEQSFNRITVDGDTSTNDCCLLAATGRSGVRLDKADPDNWRRFSDAFHELVLNLAKSIIRDAEGARKFVTVDVQQGASSKECLLVAYAIAESPLVKTALTASDPNWGRILAAVGRAGVDDLNVEKISIFLGNVCIVENGMLSASYTEEQGRAIMQQEDIEISVRLSRGTYAERVWTADLSEEYVRINASYRS